MRANGCIYDVIFLIANGFGLAGLARGMFIHP